MRIYINRRLNESKAIAKEFSASEKGQNNALKTFNYVVRSFRLRGLEKITVKWGDCTQ